MFGAVGVVFLIVVLVAGGKGQAAEDVGPQGALQRAERAVFAHLELVLGFPSAQAERELHAGDVAVPVGHLDVQDVAAVFSNGVDLFQTQPGFAWRRRVNYEDSLSPFDDTTPTGSLYFFSPGLKSKRAFTGQAAKALHVSLPQLIEVH